MKRLSKSAFAESPEFDFGPNSTVDEITLRREPGSVPLLTLMVSSNGATFRLHCIGPSNAEGVGLLLDAWSLKVFDLNKIDGFHHDFGRFVLEFSDDDDQFPYSFTADSVSVVGEP